MEQHPAAADRVAFAAVGDSAASGCNPLRQTLSSSTHSVVYASSSSGHVSSVVWPAGHVATVAYQPLATGSSTGGSCNDFPASFISSEHATSTAASKNGTSQHVIGSPTLSAPLGDASNTQDATERLAVHQQPTGQSLSGFSDLKSLI
jgi:hypothetical protein